VLGLLLRSARLELGDTLKVLEFRHLENHDHSWSRRRHAPTMTARTPQRKIVI
jgi:hypothetical protein